MARAIAELADERTPLPGPSDREEILPPVLACFGRRIPSTDLVVLYTLATDGALVLRAVR